MPSKRINALHVSGDDIYVGLYNKGIFVTSNEGRLWRSLNGKLSNLNVQGILKVKDEIFIGTDVGIYKTKDDFIDWQLKHSGIQI